MVDIEKAISAAEHGIRMAECAGNGERPGRAYTVSILTIELDNILGVLKEYKKKQEPVKPYRPEELWLCGECDAVVGWDDLFISDDDVRHKFCPNCGRTVKWDG